MSKEFIEFCKKDGTKKETIVPSTPKHNGLFKRKNMSILEVAHAMLHDQKVLCYWKKRYVCGIL